VALCETNLRLLSGGSIPQSQVYSIPQSQV
jgi:hypothetical protein